MFGHLPSLWSQQPWAANSPSSHLHRVFLCMAVLLPLEPPFLPRRDVNERTPLFMSEEPQSAELAFAFAPNASDVPTPAPPAASNWVIRSGSSLWMRPHRPLLWLRHSVSRWHFSLISGTDLAALAPNPLIAAAGWNEGTSARRREGSNSIPVLPICESWAIRSGSSL